MCGTMCSSLDEMWTNKQIDDISEDPLAYSNEWQLNWIISQQVMKCGYSLIMLQQTYKCCIGG